MRVFRGFDELPALRNAVVTVGSFDGLHRGHLSLLDAVADATRKVGGESVVLTFDPHPRIVLGRAEGLRLLTSIDEKIALLDGLGIDNLIIIPFDKDFSRLSQSDFVKQYLVGKIALNTLVMGFNHRLGRGDDATHSDLVALSEECGFSIVQVEEWRDAECNNVSSTVVRNLISRGDIDQANSLLARPYSLLGRVDDSGRVWIDDVLKAEPAVGRYQVVANGVESTLDVNDSGIITLMGDLEDKNVKIEVIKKL